MIAYENKVLFEDNFKEYTIVLDVNCQGVLEFEHHQRQLKRYFPETVQMLVEASITGTLSPGMVLRNEEDGFKLLLIVTRYARVGALKDDNETIIRNTMRAVESITEKKVVSPLINRDVSSCWPALHPKIKSMDINWVVYTK
jgi:hypothetical protein